jgi:hypothetical protein
MNNLVETIEQFDPGHFTRRYDYLLKVSEQVRSMGFFPLQITQRDIECYWVRVETKCGKWYSLYVEMVYDMKAFPDLLNALKEVARYEER